MPPSLAAILAALERMMMRALLAFPLRHLQAGPGDVTDCRQIQDTNKDGTVDQNDSCIPIGGFINALRPIELAKPLIQAAQAGPGICQPI